MSSAVMSSRYGWRPADARLDVMPPWVFCQWWYAHQLRSPSRGYALTVWSDDWDPQSQTRPVAGQDFFLNHKVLQGNPHWICFPDRPCFKNNRDYQTFRHSWILVERSYPMVPCAGNTPLPNRKQSKQQRAKILSVYLRPWTLIATEATATKPYIANLDAVQVADVAHTDMRMAWKQYYTTGMLLFMQDDMNLNRARNTRSPACCSDGCRKQMRQTSTSRMHCLPKSKKTELA